MTTNFRDRYEYKIYPYSASTLTADELNKVGGDGWLLVATLPNILFARRCNPRLDPPTEAAPPAKANALTPLLLSQTEAAHALGISRVTLYRLIKANTIRVVRLGRMVRIPADAIAELARFD